MVIVGLESHEILSVCVHASYEYSANINKGA